MRITIKEYMPDALCSRSRDVLPITVNAGELPLYKTYLSEFIELNRSLQSLGSSPGIQRVTDVFSENSTAYAILEYALGRSVKNELKNTSGGMLPWERVKEIFPPMLMALSRVNAAGIIHRGISPKTVFINEQSQVYLADFAITAARINGSKINEEVFSGYAAPEQYNSNARHGDWTDVYGLSALLYKVLTGVTPQDASERLKNDTLIAPAEINETLPANVSKAIMSGMELSADKRIKTVSELTELIVGKLPANGHTSSTTLAFSPIRGNAPISVDVPAVEVDLAEEPDSIHDLEEEIALAARKLAKERQKKIKRIAILSVITAILVVFAILIMVAIFNPDVFESCVRDNRPPPQTNATSEGRTAATSGDNTLTIPPVGDNQVTNFVGVRIDENMMKQWERDFGFLNFKFEPQYSEEHARDVVFEQSVEHLAIVPAGTDITIRYSLGQEFIRMPDFAGMKVEDLRRQLISMGVRNENITVEEQESPVFTVEGMVDAVSIEVGNNVRLTSFPNDPARQADAIVIYLAIPIPVETTARPNTTARVTTARTTATTARTTATTTAASTYDPVDAPWNQTPPRTEPPTDVPPPP
jgi:serine/threonine-protein kinase